jgi:hypothetical protein
MKMRTVTSQVRDFIAEILKPLTVPGQKGLAKVVKKQLERTQSSDRPERINSIAGNLLFCGSQINRHVGNQHDGSPVLNTGGYPW